MHGMQDVVVEVGATIPWSAIPSGCLFLHKCGAYEMRLDDRHYILGYLGAGERFSKDQSHRWDGGEDECDVRVVALGLNEAFDTKSLRRLAEGVTSYR